VCDLSPRDVQVGDNGDGETTDRATLERAILSIRDDDEDDDDDTEERDEPPHHIAAIRAF